jgi:hypothetical protein
MRHWNGRRFDPEAGGGHVESWFWKLNDADGRRALWLKATILARPGAEPVAEGWAIAFDRETGHVAAKEVVPFASAGFSRDALDVRVAGARFEPGKTRGRLCAKGHEIEWDLAFGGSAAPIVPLPRRLYADATGNSKLVTPHPDVAFSGSYAVDGRRVEVDGWRGMQGHNWGRRHVHAYAWVHANVWPGAEGLVFEGITARVALGPLLSPPVSLLCVEHAGERHAFGLPASLWRARGRIGARDWRVRASNGRARVDAHFEAATADFVGLHYENPDGAMTYCLNSKIAQGRLRLEVEGRAPVEAETRAAALEIGTRDADHGVAMLA